MPLKWLLPFALIAFCAPAWALLPTGNPLPNATIPTTPWTLELEDVVTIPNNGGAFPRLEFLTGGGALDTAYVIDQLGKIYSFDPAAGSPTASLFLDVAANVANFKVGTQTGVRGLAFHPDFNNSGATGFRKFYTAHSRNAFVPGVGSPGPVFFNSPPGLNHDSVVGEWTVNANGTVNTSSYREVMRIGQPFSDHNIGQIGFNPNSSSGESDFGNLYIALGDGGNNFPPNPIDPHNTGQSLDTWVHGSILRIDPVVSGGNPYSIPSDNPFRVSSNAGTPRNAIWAYGLRNPHRFTFDTAGDEKMLISDIGQSNIEEINLGQAGANYGWDLREGTFQTTASFSGSNNLLDTLPGGHASDAFTYPVAQYDHDPDNNNNIEGLWGVVGGSVYRGSNIPALTGKYLFGDFAVNHGPIYAVDVDDLVQREDFSNLSNLNDGLLAPLVELSLTFNGQPTTLLQLIRNASGNQGLSRTDLRFGVGPDDEIYVLNKHDGIVRRIASVAGLLLGDYNGNGVVDAADYTTWLDALGGTNLLNDSTPGVVDASDYSFWKANFGGTLATGSFANAPQIPEPTSVALALLACFACLNAVRFNCR